MFLLEIFQEILKKYSKARLLLVGGGDGIHSIQEKVKDMGMGDRVIFTGVRSDVNRLMQAMNVFVFPSLYEGLPVTMIEAQASGLHCVISDRVSKECIITESLVSSMSLEESPTRWAEYILQQSCRRPVNHIEEIQKAGYDILTEAKKLENFYLKNTER